MKKNDRHGRREGKLTKPALYKQQKYSPLLWRLLCVPVICVQCVYVVTWNHRENVPRIPGGFGVMARSLEPPEWCWECGLATEEQQNKGKVPPYFHTFIYTCCHVNACTHTHTPIKEYIHEIKVKENTSENKFMNYIFKIYLTSFYVLT